MSTKNHDPARLGEFSYEVHGIAIVREGAGADLQFTPASDLVAIIIVFLPCCRKQAHTTGAAVFPVH